jgi:hypothetical protein
MARIVYSGLVNSIRGSVGGTTFQKNAYGYTIKNKANVIKPNTARQSLQKRAMQLAIQGWMDLSPTDRAIWDGWASSYPQFSQHNPTSQLTGYAVYVRRNVLQAFIGQPLLDSPGSIPPIIPTLSIALTQPAGFLSFTTGGTTSATELTYWLYLSAPVRPSRAFVGSVPKFIASYFVNPTVHDIFSAYVLIFGAEANPADYVLCNLVIAGTDSAIVYKKQALVLIVT